MRIQKEKLLQTKLFIDNDKLDKYVNLINVGDNIADYTEKHHIIPKSYFRIIGQRIDNSRGNIIKLSYFNHILAHYYLSLCTIGRLRQANIIAFTLLINTGVEILTKSEVEAVKQLKEAAILHEEAKKICRDKCSELGNMKKTAEHKKALKEARDLHSTTKGKKSIYNPLSNKVKFVYSTEIDDYLKAG